MAKPSCPRCGGRRPCCCNVRPCAHTAHLPGVAHVPAPLSDGHARYWRARVGLAVELGDRVAAHLATGDTVALAARINGGVVWSGDPERARRDVLGTRTPRQGVLDLVGAP